MSIMAAAAGPEPPCSTSSRESTIFTGRRHFCASLTAAASPWMAILPPKPPPTSSGTTLSFDAGSPSMAEIISSAVNCPCVDAHTVAKPLASTSATTTCGSRYPWCAVSILTLARALARACPSAACVSPRPITVREHRLLGVFGLGSTPLVSTCSCSTGAPSASAASMSSTAGSRS